MTCPACGCPEALGCAFDCPSRREDPTDPEIEDPRIVLLRGAGLSLDDGPWWPKDES